MNAVSTQVDYGSGSGWLTVTRSGSGNSQSLTNSSVVSGLSAGSYNATVVVSCANAADSPQSYTVTLTVSGGSNRAPSVDAGSNQTITLPAASNLEGTASDPDGDSLTTTWTKVSGPGTVAFGDPSAGHTTASFSLAGTYVLHLTADDGEFRATDEVTVTVNPAPSDDTDGDGLPDDWEEEHFGSASLCGPGDDPDADGLTNQQEFTAGTDPQEADTDGDGLLDGDDPKPLHAPAPAPFHGNGGGCGNAGAAVALAFLVVWRRGASQ